MTKDEVVEALLKVIQMSGLDPTASKIDGEPAVGIELEDGSEFFIVVQDA